MSSAYRGHTRPAIPSTIWPGFVDALTGVLLVLIFTISTFVIVQFLLRDELAGRGRALNLAESRINTLMVRLEEETRRGEDLRQSLDRESATRLSLSAELEELRQVSEKRLAALRGSLEAAERALREERTRSAEAEEREREALALLETLDSAADSRSEPLEAAVRRREELEEQVSLLIDRLDAESDSREARESEIALERKRVGDLNEQVADLRGQILELQEILRASELRDFESQAVIRNLGRRLNAALAQQVGELSRYRSDFFGRMRETLGDRDDIRIEGDRFVFQSGVLFASGSAELGSRGKVDLAAIADALDEIVPQIPGDIDWLLRVDGHTDARAVRSGSRFRDNWELSQARALAVVRYFVEERGLPPARFAAAGFGAFRPVDPGNDDNAHARNRRMELTFTSR